MIALLTYLYYTLWDVEVNKEFFAGISAFEVAIELYILICCIAIYQPWKK